MQPSNQPLKETALASWYQGESLEEYLDAMFHYYEAQDIRSVVKAVKEEESTAIPSLVDPFKPTHRSLFENILAKFGLSLSDASFDEIIKGDYYSVLNRHGLVDHQPLNNPSFTSLGGVI